MFKFPVCLETPESAIPPSPRSIFSHHVSYPSHNLTSAVCLDSCSRLASDVRSRRECPNQRESGRKRACHVQSPPFLQCHVLLSLAIPFLLKERAHLVSGCSIRTTFMTPRKHCAFLVDFMAFLTNWFQHSVLKCAGFHKY